MNTPSPQPGRVVIRDTKRRDTLIAVGVGLVILVFVALGIRQMSRPVQGNKLIGEIVEKVFIPAPERQVAFTGRKIEGVKEIAGEYVLRVQVKEVNRTYDVPVPEFTYRSKKVGDSFTFIRPPSEQK
jgi:hypothetical protein